MPHIGMESASFLLREVSVRSRAFAAVSASSKKSS
jgi:hypothetical protein